MNLSEEAAGSHTLRTKTDCHECSDFSAAAPRSRASNSSALFGAGASQWRCLGEALDHSYQLMTPEHYGCESSGPWHG